MDNNTTREAKWARETSNGPGKAEWPAKGRNPLEMEQIIATTRITLVWGQSSNGYFQWQCNIIYTTAWSIGSNIINLVIHVPLNICLR